MDHLKFHTSPNPPPADGFSLPLAAPGLAASWLAVYVLAATEYEASTIVVPPGRELLAVTVVNMVHYGRDAEIAACALLLVAAVALPLLPLAAAFVLFGREKRS